jgi:hypothetical protein
MAADQNQQPLEPSAQPLEQVDPPLSATPDDSQGAGPVVAAGEYGGGYCGESCGACGMASCQEGCAPCGNYCGVGHGCYPIGWWLRDAQIFAGVHGFKGPLDQGRNGNFGIHEGANLGFPLFGTGWGFQVGVNAVHSNFEGDQTQQAFSPADRNQVFLTTAIFERALCGGLQWGVAFDVLRDNYADNYNLKQLRTETSLVRAGCREIGYYGAYGLGTDRTIDGRLDPTDMFVLFYRKYLENGGEGRFWGGFSGSGDGLFGADAWVPMGHSWALDARFNYLVPGDSQDAAQTKESWGLSIQLVWFLGQSAQCARCQPFRPLFNVADNSLFMVDRLH